MVLTSSRCKTLACCETFHKASYVSWNRKRWQAVVNETVNLPGSVEY
jgi:hypothetical protein